MYVRVGELPNSHAQFQHCQDPEVRLAFIDIDNRWCVYSQSAPHIKIKRTKKYARSVDLGPQLTHPTDVSVWEIKKHLKFEEQKEMRVEFVPAPSFCSLYSNLARAQSTFHELRSKRLSKGEVVSLSNIDSSVLSDLPGLITTLFQSNDITAEDIQNLWSTHNERAQIRASILEELYVLATSLRSKSSIIGLLNTWGPPFRPFVSYASTTEGSAPRGSHYLDGIQSAEPSAVKLVSSAFEKLYLHLLERILDVTEHPAIRAHAANAWVCPFVSIQHPFLLQNALLTKFLLVTQTELSGVGRLAQVAIQTIALGSVHEGKTLDEFQCLCLSQYSSSFSAASSSLLSLSKSQLGKQSVIQFLTEEGKAFECLLQLVVMSQTPVVLSYVATPAFISTLFSIIRSGSPRLQGLALRFLPKLLSVISPLKMTSYNPAVSRDQASCGDGAQRLIRELFWLVGEQLSVGQSATNAAFSPRAFVTLNFSNGHMQQSFASDILDCLRSLIVSEHAWQPLLVEIVDACLQDLPALCRLLSEPTLETSASVDERSVNYRLNLAFGALGVIGGQTASYYVGGRVKTSAEEGTCVWLDRSSGKIKVVFDHNTHAALDCDLESLTPVSTGSFAARVAKINTPLVDLVPLFVSLLNARLAEEKQVLSVSLEA
jgi:hypothetical protein